MGGCNSSPSIADEVSTKALAQEKKIIIKAETTPSTIDTQRESPEPKPIADKTLEDVLHDSVSVQKNSDFQLALGDFHLRVFVTGPLVGVGE